MSEEREMLKRLNELTEEIKASKTPQAKQATGGIGFCGALFLVFLVLKLCEVITWSWWWVTAPLWAIPALIIGILLILLLIWIIASVVTGLQMRAWEKKSQKAEEKSIKLTQETEDMLAEAKRKLEEK